MTEVLLLLAPGDIERRSLNGSDMTLAEGCCNEKTCADSDTYGLRGCPGGCSKDLRSDRDLEIDVVGDA